MGTARCWLPGLRVEAGSDGCFTYSSPEFGCAATDGRHGAQMLHAFRLLRSQLSATSVKRDGRQWQRLLAALASAETRSSAEHAMLLREICQLLCASHGVLPEISGVLPSGPVVLVANHLGYVDPLVICGLVPCSPIAKRSLATWPIVGGTCKRLNVQFLDRTSRYDGARVLRAARRLLGQGVSVLNFPEGTTTRGEMLPFKRGVFGLAKRLGIAVVPLALKFEDEGLCWVDQENFLSHYLRFCTRRPHRLTLHVGPELRARRNESAVHFAQRAQCWIAQRLACPATPTPWREASGHPRALSAT